MGTSAIFFWFFAVLFVLRAVAATFVYAWLLSDAPDCPSCGGEALHVEHRGVQRLFPKLRPSWCPVCNWEGLLHHAPPHPPPLHAGRPGMDTASVRGPLISKKSSK